MVVDQNTVDTNMNVLTGKPLFDKPEKHQEPSLNKYLIFQKNPRFKEEYEKYKDELTEMRKAKEFHRQFDMEKYNLTLPESKRIGMPNRYVVTPISYEKALELEKQNEGFFGDFKIKTKEGKGAIYFNKDEFVEALRLPFGKKSREFKDIKRIMRFEEKLFKKEMEKQVGESYAPLEYQADVTGPTYMEKDISELTPFSDEWYERKLGVVKDKDGRIRKIDRNAYLTETFQYREAKEVQEKDPVTGEVRTRFIEQGTPPPKTIFGNVDAVKWEKFKKNLGKFSYIIPLLETSYGPSIEKGFFRAMEGIARIPFEISAELGSDRARKLSNRIREVFPQFPDNENALEDLIMYTAQYMPLTGGSIRGASTATKSMLNLFKFGFGKNVNPATKERALNYLNVVIGMYVNDFLVTKGDEGTLTESILGKSSPDILRVLKSDPLLERKFKIAFESAGVGLLMNPLIGGVSKGGTLGLDALAATFKNTRRSQKVADNVAAEFAQSKVYNKDEVIKEIDNFIKEGDQLRTKPSEELNIREKLLSNRNIKGEPEPLITVSQGIGNDSLIRLEKATAGIQGPEYYSRREAFMDKISEDIDERIRSRMKDADIKDAGETMRELAKLKEIEMDEALKRFEAAERQAIIDAQNSFFDFLDTSSRKIGDYTEAFDKAIFEGMERFNRTKNYLYNMIDPQFKVPVSKQGVKRFANYINEHILESGKTQKRIANRIEQAFLKQGGFDPSDPRYSELYDDFLKSAEGGNLTFGRLMDIRSQLSEVRNAIYKDGVTPTNMKAIERLKKFQEEVIDPEIETLSKSKNATYRSSAQAAITAKNWWVKHYKPVLGLEGTTGAEFKRTAYRNRWLPEKTAKEFLQFNQTSLPTHTAKQIERLLKHSNDPVQAQANVAELVVESIAKIMKDKNSISIKHFEYLIKNDRMRALIKQFPDIEKSLKVFEQNFRKNHGKLSSNDFLTEQIRNMGDVANKTKKDWEISAVKFFLTDDIDNAVRRAFEGTDPVRQTKELMDLADLDPTGNAKDGLVATFRNYISNKISSNIDAVKGNPDRPLGLVNQINEILRNRTKKESYVQFQKYAGENPKKALKNLEILRDQLQQYQNYEKKNGYFPRTQAESEALGNNLRLALASAYGIVRGQGIYWITNVLYKAFVNRGGSVTDLAQKVLSEMVWDPKLLRFLLTKDPTRRMGMAGSTRKQMKDATAYIMSNIGEPLLRLGKEDQPAPEKKETPKARKKVDIPWHPSYRRMFGM